MPSLQFKGKSFVQNYHLAVPFHEIIPVKEKSLTDKPSLTDNLIIHGDNLKALKSLLPIYAGKINCVYIDPPYNTGNEEWHYNDNVNSPMMQEWLGKTVDREDLTRHDKWLCMMTPRLKVLKELLSNDGVIFSSIDDHEQHHLKNLMNEVFGEENFVANAIWQKKYSPQNDATGLSEVHEYIVIYAKDSKSWRPNLLARTEEGLSRYKNPDNDKRGPWKVGDLTSKTKAKGHSYPIKGPTGKTFLPSPGRQWAPSLTTFQRLLKENRIWFGLSGENVPSLKQFLSEVQAGTVPTTLWLRELVGDNEFAKKEIQEIFKEEVSFETPKPSTLIKQILKIACGKNAIILDSFAGSGTTAHAALSLNKEDEGNRKFILVEMENYADKITAERVRRVIKGVKSSENEELKEGLGGSFTFCELGEPMDEQRLLSGKSLPTYDELARYVFYVSTGEEFKPSALNKSTGFIGESSKYHVYMFYEPKVDVLRNLALDLDKAEKMKPLKDGKRRLVFAPTKYLDQEYLDKYQIDFSQLPYEIYQRAK